MRIAVVGANGRTGRLTVEQALTRGHQVAALARQEFRATRSQPGLTTSVVDVLDRDAVAAGLAGVDAVISTLGIGTSKAASVTYSQGVANLLHGMQRHGIKRIIVVSAMPVGPWSEHARFDRYVVLPLLERFFGATYRDMRRMEEILAGSEVEWTSIRPPRLTDKPATGGYRLSTAGPLPKARVLTYPDLAAALLDAVGRDELSGQAAYVAN
ncbi:NAD(P)H-binding protein [Natronosporangium hydrolyticum]|uniref:NAD(P)H-binding protein n=1 Tax=Natronosporangium hydrolyticum TaxID=2811111 RepID=A0A895YKX0_9ACTN|nr:NAD(P)H-binding protein [Natronosporangium hydrolyticum]QSB15943.1 NAD(P)H-binding protein [Natronosporangium hydrolyticum]